MEPLRAQCDAQLAEALDAAAAVHEGLLELGAIVGVSAQTLSRQRSAALWAYSRPPGENTAVQLGRYTLALLRDVRAAAMRLP